VRIQYHDKQVRLFRDIHTKQTVRILSQNQTHRKQQALHDEAQHLECARRNLHQGGGRRGTEQVHKIYVIGVTTTKDIKDKEEKYKVGRRDKNGNVK
jgi:hypothetical protein